MFLLIVFAVLMILLCIGLVFGIFGLVFGLLKFILPVILIAAVVNWLLGGHHQSQGKSNQYDYRQANSPHDRTRKEVQDAKERDLHETSKNESEDNDEWSDF